MEPMLSEDAIAELEKQQYRIVGERKHSAVKVCGWTKNMLRGKGGCYKLKFYGIRSHQCLQMTTSMSCANRCVFCWRGRKAPVSKEWRWGMDDPEDIIEESLEAQRHLLYGFGGHPTADKQLYEESKDVKHVALSLSGEPITYPLINEAVAGFHRRGISTFLVTNAQHADEIRDLAPVTQLYLSVDAPSEELLKEIDRPLFPDYWERLLRSLDHAREKRGRTTIRITAIKGMNMVDPAGYAELILRGDPDFVEVKAYMFVGASRQALSIKNMPYHEEVESFAKEILEHLPEYGLADEHKPSRVVLLAKKQYYDEEKKSWETWIDFDAFFKRWKDYESGKARDIPTEECSVRWTRGHVAKDLEVAEGDVEEKDLD
ncbi:4-demethylwyosine synthase TYW1 [Candidatus Woesearchaeota archaeon]|nr:4-demethylwyosine synthase TYW1 [Candidatus Woesearchaeota archaeon]